MWIFTPPLPTSYEILVTKVNMDPVKGGNSAVFIGKNLLFLE